ncbi:E3 SUMO-protein ligase RanBP2-like isoform X2 [Photinus pyralis]|uniref:E3 SUMO-protein ligase RanBP2 n=1 Tax=Photinus pyralis TaxID=7054 RepID=A0A1Y1N939_PHOPY|nr:E3 SUMO-protein ligase RanBP2-like isoform X2 [Photinus pyralis]
MFNTKLEVDRHVESCLKKINNETERNLRSFAFAKLYFKVGEFEYARRHVSAYLMSKPMSAEAQSFLGKILEKQGKVEAALDAFRRSLALDSKQNGLIMKVCELLSSGNIPTDVTTLRSYCEDAQRIDPHNPIVYKLKERLIAAESEDPNDVTKLLLTELETRSTDVSLRVRLLRHLLDNNELSAAYKHASDIEMKNVPVFLNSLAWYEVVGEVLVRYQRENVTLTQDFWMLLVSVLDKLASLTLNIHFSNIKTASECKAAVFNLDQTLGIAAKHLGDIRERPLVREFLTHYRAQVCFHLSCLLYKQAKMDLIKFKDATNLLLPLLFISYNTQPPDINGVWLDHSEEIHKLQMKKWFQEANFRCSQTGHILQMSAKEHKTALIEKVTQSSSGLWREQLFKKLFITRDEQMKMNDSYFMTCPELLNVCTQLPEVGELKKYDGYAQLMHPDSLHNLVWLCLSKPLASFKCTVFDGLQYSVRNLNNCSAESLNLLDVESFIYCATLTVQSQLDHNIDRSLFMPVSITDQLGTLQQSKWLKTAYMMYKNDYGINFSEVRLNLIRGIEVVRCCGNHGLDVKMLATLASVFTERARHLTKQSEVEFNEARADLYWKAALPLLEKLQNNQAINYGQNRLFEYKTKEMPASETLSYIEDARLFNGQQLLKKKEYERALLVFDSLKNPYASYYQAQIYKSMAEEQLNQNKENVTSEMRSQHIILLSRSRDCFYLTLDRLRDPLVDRKHPLNKQLGTEIEKIERLLSRIDSDVYNYRNECEGLSDENFSTNGSIGDHVNNFFSSTHYPGESLTPHLDRTHYSSRFRTEPQFKREARPSPERLDAQLRQMQATRDATMGQMVEQNRLIADSHKTLVEEFRWLKEAVTNITSSVNDFKATKPMASELQEIKNSITDLKGAVEELQTFRNVTDVVQEMKKEIADLKKEQAKSKNQLSDEDLYVLDDEYATDYGINSNVAAFNPNSLYPRIPPTYQPPALYPGMYPVYPYPNLGLPQAGALPFGQETQIPDFRALNLPQPLAQPTYGQPNLVNKPPWDLGVVQPGLAQLNVIPPVMVPQIPAQTQQANIFRDTVSTTITTTSIFPPLTTIASPANKAPNNVVITSSDPLPKSTVATTQVLSVTIPPQHLKGNVPLKSHPHNYQIPLPTTSSTLNMTPTVIHQPPPVVTTQGLLSNIAPPVYSAVGSKSATLGLQIEKTLNQSFNNSTDGRGNLSSRSLDEHDPCPDFKPIVPLPDEVPLNTGEENELVLFSERAKLFRFTDKEWRERGVGNIKILEDNDTGKIRIVMRRDQVHKICANHFLTKDMVLSPMPNSGKAFMWAANDFADQEMILETLCVRFKTEEEAKAFFVAFENAKARLRSVKDDETSDVSTSLGGFTFTSTPTFKPKEQSVTASVTPVPDTTTTGNSSPFASFSFGAKAQILFDKKDPKPAAVCDENAEILFESHAELSKYDVDNKEWKECGVGVIKLLKEHTIRLMMRQDHQVLKVCCNHQLLKSTKFKKMPKSPKTISWCAQDCSEGAMRPEMFTIRFQSDEQTDTFYKAVLSAKDLLDDNNVVKSEEKVAIMEIKSDGNVKGKKEEKKVKADVGETVEQKLNKSKSKTGSWKCKTCFIANEGKDHFCIACETPKNNTTPNKSTSEPIFSFGASQSSTSPGFIFGKEPANSWGDAFKPPVGSWECQQCLVRNDGTKLYCISCEAPKNGTVPAKKENAQPTFGLQFTFGIPKPISATDSTLKGEETYFKPVTQPSHTGEEVLYCHRTKLYQFSDNNWKERGVGDIKILRNCANKTLRVVMYREQPLQLCLDHVLTAAIEYLPKDEKAWTFTAPDFSEGKINNCKFYVKFKTSKLAQDFKSAVDDALNQFKAGSDKCRNQSDVEIVSEIQVSAEEEAEAIRLKLPPKFMAYRDLVKSTSPSEKQVTFGTPETLKDILAKPKLSVAPSMAAEPFKPFAFSTKTDKPPVSKSLFGSTSTPMIGSTPPTFATSTDLTKGEPIFKVDPNLSFASLSNLTGGGLAFGKIPEGNDKSFTFLGSGAPVFGSQTKKDKSKDEGDGEEEHETTEEYDPHYEPIVPLPEAIVVSTGEEEEVAVFDERAKLFRYDNDTKEWKERGVGQMKILHHPQKGTYRFILRREQVHKVVLNMLITASLELQPMVTSDKAWLWYGINHTDDGQQAEKLAVRFKNCDLSNKFQTIVENIITKVKDFKPVTSVEKTTTEVPAEVPKVSWDQFKPKAGTWKCKTCDIYNEAKDHFCVACETPKSNASSGPVFSFGASPQSTSGGVNFNPSQFSFGTPVTTTASSTSFIFGQKPVGANEQVKDGASGWGDAFKPKPGSWECPKCLIRNDADKVRCASCDHLKDTFGFTFGDAATDPFKSTEESRDQFVFGSPQQHAFEFTPRSPRRHSSGGQGEESDSFVEDEGDHIYFKPVVPLPNKVEVKTGEEDEEVLYCHRAKLFRFIDGEWKERGLGDLKILHSKVNKKLRIVMRREQVLKICLNHVLTAEIEYLAKDDKTWLFSAPDFSEGEINHWQFCVRFKSSDIAREFKSAVDDALKRTHSASPSTSVKEDVSEVEFISETQVSAEEEQEAIRLKLPPKFMAYRQRPDCTCETCKSEDAIAAPPHTSPIKQTDAFKSFSFSLKTDTPTIFSQTPSKSAFSNSPTSGGNIFGTPVKPAQNIFGNTNIFRPSNLLAVGQGKPSSTSENELVFKADPNLSFSSLSNLKTDSIAFGTKAEEGDKVFSFLGSGQPVFGSAMKSQLKKDEGEESETEAGEEYDPHYEPIVPLPEVVAVSTGEEEEAVIFDERAKLFRYDNNSKEWKERGVGQMKILHHPINATYRFILRREQVHKVVLNMLITSSLELQQMITSDKAWMWYGVNHTDEGAQMEKLAVRFKSCELAQAFRLAVEKVLASIKEHEKTLPSMLQSFGLDVSDEHSEYKEDDDDEEEDEEEEEDERTIMFMKPCRLSEEIRPGEWKEICSGDLSMYYEPEFYASRIFMCDQSGNEIVNTSIEADTEMMFEDNYCIWKTTDWQDNNVRLRTVKATFSTPHDAENFHCRYLESLQYAQETSNDEE